MRKLVSLFSLLILCSCAEEKQTSSVVFVTIPEGEAQFGLDDGADHESPMVKCQVQEFELSETEVSNAEFEEFVNATGYVTDVEKKGGFVFQGGWRLSNKANWRNPYEGKVDREKWINLPAVLLSYADALAFCKWAGCRLPSEIEWEYAAKLGESASVPMNISDPEGNYPAILPVRSNEKNKLGVYHQSGNVWEWCADSYNFTIHDKLKGGYIELKSGEAYLGRSWDLTKKDAKDTLRVIKGGSILCSHGFCEGFRPDARQSAEQHQGYSHIGFRVAKSIK